MANQVKKKKRKKDNLAMRLLKKVLRKLIYYYDKWEARKAEKQAKVQKEQTNTQEIQSVDKQIDTKNKKVKKKKSIKDRLIKYAKVWLSVVLVIMVVLWLYLFHYERSQVSHAISDYKTQLINEEINKQKDSILTDLDTSVQTEDQAIENLKTVIQDDIEFHKDTENTTNEVSAFIIKYNGNQIGTVSFKKSFSFNIFGLKKWSVQEGSVDLSGLKKTASVNVPSGWSVYVNDTQLDDSHITSQQPYTGYESFYDDGNTLGLPMLNQYTTGNVIGSVSTTVVDPNGKKYKESKITDTTFLTQASSDEITRADSFISAFLPAYIQCLSNANHDASGNFYSITPYLLYGGTLYNRLYNAIEGQSWANSSGDTLLNYTINDLYNFGSGYYICDVTYELETIGTAGAVQNTLYAKILLQATEDSFVAVDITNY